MSRLLPADRHSSRSQDALASSGVATRPDSARPTGARTALGAITAFRDRFATFLYGDVDAANAEELERRLVASYQHMLTIVLFPGLVYFVVIGVSYYFTEGLESFLRLGSISFIIAATMAMMLPDMMRRPLSRRVLEFRGLALLLMIYGKHVVHHTHNLEPAKLIFFLLLALVAATASISFSITGFALVICTAATLWFAEQAGDVFLAQYIAVAFATWVVAVSLAAMTRVTISREIHSGIVAERLRAEAEHMASHDLLTGLPNRRNFFRMLETRFATRGEASPAFALAIVDLDRFKAVNDTFGHLLGDELLMKVSERLVKACTGECFVARLAGDEFALIIGDPKDAETLKRFGLHIRSEIEKPFTVQHVRISLSASVGIALAQADVGSAAELMGRTDYALYSAKDKKAGVLVFSAELSADRSKMRAIEHELRNCDYDEEMYVVFQPQTDVRTGETLGFEALARWDNPELGQVQPDVFIRLAERIGVITDLTALLLAKSLTAARDWPEPLKLSFNLSIRDLDSPAAVDNICRVVRESGFPPHRIEFEVTESLVMKDFEQARNSLSRLHRLGALIALDDFGSGYANFAHIDQLHIDTIKIDRSFVKRMKDNPRSAKIIKTMIDMCATLDVGCVVEGAETEQELDVLRSIGALNVQGYYYSEPMTVEEMPAYLSRSLLKRIRKTVGKRSAKAS